ncbi:RNA polymerase sigma factor [Siphonobacter aquaeclarae]|jgi:RNA polymerase sigma-70 factor (family 1)|uniref:RNA polymerase sigma-70 factor, ECF subfamily n=1 Tax=Siphonobacter aquaeclarae TaxID=563176 RepID=A0A1G9PAN9_9BACT|nr:RNA polymerase sigma-70 factor [Siphonobacter aquaeclarae]SDL95774.1 RNA polymerase sigma-70 factor, ECF subfamily [Siphonobacter aquaeclarae]
MKRYFDTCDDQELFLQMSHDDVLAFEEIYRRYAGRLANAAYKRLQNKDLTEEVVQELFVNIWMKRHQIVIRKTADVYLHTALRNLVISHFRHQSRQEAFEEVREWDPWSNETEERVYYNDMHRDFEETIGHLPEKCRQVFDLYQQGKSISEIAVMLDVSPKTVESHLMKANQTLRLRVKKFVASLGSILVLLPL